MHFKSLINPMHWVELVFYPDLPDPAEILAEDLRESELERLTQAKKLEHARALLDMYDERIFRLRTELDKIGPPKDVSEREPEPASNLYSKEPT